MKVSVCIATYNGGAFIHQQISSILLQLSINDEVIVSDDHSTDNTLEIIRRFNDPRIRIVLNPNQRGLCNNFENALRTSSGKLIFLSDQDDIWLPMRLEYMKRLLLEYDMVVTDAKVVDHALNIVHHSYFELRKCGPGLVKNIFKNSYLGCCMGFRREILTLALPIPNRVKYHDYWLGIVAEMFFRPFFLKVPLLYYRRHDNNLSQASHGKSTYSVFTKLLYRTSILQSIPMLILRKLLRK